MAAPGPAARGGVRAALLRIGALAIGVLLAATSVAQEVPDLPAGPGTLSGQVVHAATGDPVPDAEVVLYALTAQGVPGLRKVKSGPDGRFAIENISNDPAISYLLGAQHQGIPFPGARVNFAAGQTLASADVRLTELTRSPDAIRAEIVELRLQRDAQGLRVLQATQLANGGSATYSVPADERGPSGAAFEATLPPGAAGFQMPLGVIPDGIQRDGDVVRYFGPIYPGVHDLSWTYTLPPASGDDGEQRFVLEGRIPEGSALRLLVPEGLGPVRSDALEAEAAPQMADGAPHTRYSGRGGAYRIELSPPPARVDPEATRITEAQAILDVDDAAVAVRETVTLEVIGTGVVLGTEAQPLVHLRIPAAATDIRFATDATGASLIPHPDGGLAAIGTTGPGSWRVEVRYQLAVESLPIVFERHFDERVPRFSVFVGDTGEWAPASDRMHRRRPVRTDDLSYLHLEAFEVAPHETVRISLDRLAPRSRASQTIALLGSVGLGLIAVLWLSVPLWVARDLEAEVDEVSSAQREREGIIAAIQDLDHDFETGKISEADHAEMRGALRARAIELLRAERDGVAEASGPDEPADAPTAARRCGACSVALDAEYRFCPHCGASQIDDGASADPPASEA